MMQNASTSSKTSSAFVQKVRHDVMNVICGIHQGCKKIFLWTILIYKYNDFFFKIKGTDGKSCENAPNRCVGDPCINGGICHDVGSNITCFCKPEFTGIGCQYEYDACAEGACKNGATCIDEGM